MSQELSPEVIAIAKERIARLQADHMEKLDGQKEKIRKDYEYIPRTLRRLNELTGIEVDTLITMSIHAAWHYNDLEWYQVLDVMLSLFLAKNNLEKAEKEKKEKQG